MSKVISVADSSSSSSGRPSKVDDDDSAEDDDYYDLVVPSHLLSSLDGNGTTGLSSNGECTVLVQIDPTESSELALEGATGAVGRLETDKDGLLLDLKGTQFRGTFFPGPTAMVLSVVQRKVGTSAKTDPNQPVKRPKLKVEGMTNEFCRLVKTGKAMEQLQAVVKGDMDEDYYQYQNEVDVNRSVTQTKSQEETAAEPTASETNGNTTTTGNTTKAGSRKRKAPVSKGAARKRKTNKK